MIKRFAMSVSAALLLGSIVHAHDNVDID